TLEIFILLAQLAIPWFFVDQELFRYVFIGILIAVVTVVKNSELVVLRTVFFQTGYLRVTQVLVVRDCAVMHRRAERTVGIPNQNFRSNGHNLTVLDVETVRIFTAAIDVGDRAAAAIGGRNQIAFQT